MLSSRLLDRQLQNVCPVAPWQPWNDQPPAGGKLKISVTASGVASLAA